MRNYRLVTAISVLSMLCVSWGQLQAFASEVPVAAEAVQTWKAVDIHEYSPTVGDYVIAYIPSGRGYLVNEFTQTYAEFPLLSGQKRYPTPEQEWEVKEENIQGDRVTFAASGRFLRMYHNGQYTHYGIHGHKYSAVMFGRGQIYASLGCLIVADDVLDVIVGSFDVNDKYLRVVTTSDAGMMGFLEYEGF